MLVNSAVNGHQSFMVSNLRLNSYTLWNKCSYSFLDAYLVDKCVKNYSFISFPWVEEMVMPSIPCLLSTNTL